MQGTRSACRHRLPLATGSTDDAGRLKTSRNQSDAESRTRMLFLPKNVPIGDHLSFFNNIRPIEKREAHFVGLDLGSKAALRLSHTTQTVGAPLLEDLVLAVRRYITTVSEQTAAESALAPPTSFMAMYLYSPSMSNQALDRIHPFLVL